MCVSVFVQTLNEEQNLPRCLESIKDLTDDIVVLDSLSSDGTEEVVKKYGGRFFQRAYDGRANNQNWAVENINFKYPWVWYVDADEVTQPELVEEIKSICSDDSIAEVAFFCRRNNMFMGKWLKHCGGESTWIARLWKPDKIMWDRGANPIAHIDGPTGMLKHRFTHYFFSKGYADWINRHNKYSTYEAIETVRSLQSKDLEIAQLFSSNPTVRRNALKKLSFRLPARPLFRFLHMYFISGGVLDGKPGLTYSILIAIYEYFICLKVKEIARYKKGLPM